MKTITTPKLKIYYEGQYDPIATYKPMVKREVISLAKKIDHFFVHNRWPSATEL